MIWTENDAKALWCPMTRVGDFNLGGTANRPDGSVNCLASGCMMWRKSGQIGLGPNGEKRDRDMDGRTRWLDTGYCGLAGKPDRSS
jgi:hypothetical protein